MKQSPNNQGNRNRQVVWLIIGIIAVIVIVCSVVFLILQMAPLQNLARSLSTSANPTQAANISSGTVTPIVIQVVATPLPITPTDTPQPTITLQPSATPTPSLTPTPTRTSTPTRTPTNTPTPDPWVSAGVFRAACSTEFTFAPVSASRFKFVAISGGGDDKTISFYCCGSAGAAWLVNDKWVPVANPSLTLRVGETRETSDFGSALVNRQRFNVGCNDNEYMDLRVYYLPATTAAITATATLTATTTPTATLTLTSTTPTTATVTPTATSTLTSTVPTTTTTPITSTATLTGTGTVTPTATLTPLPAAKGSIAFHKNDNGIDRALIFNLDSITITPLIDIGPVMDLAMSTNAPFGAWSPDNSRFAFISTVSSGASNILRVLDLRTNSIRPLYSSDTGGGLSSPTWSPDGTKIAFVRLAANQRVWAIDAVNADGSMCSDKYECELTTNVNGEQFRGGISWSKQGLFALAINSTGANNVFTMFADGNGRTNITNNPADNSTPAWSPDGKQIAFTSTRDGQPQIYVMPAPGSSPDGNTAGGGPRRVSKGGAADFSPTWSPDGNWIAFASYRDGSTDIYMMDLSGGNVTRLTKTGGDHPLWSR